MLHPSAPPDAFDRECQDCLNGQAITRTVLKKKAVDLSVLDTEGVAA